MAKITAIDGDVIVTDEKVQTTAVDGTKSEAFKRHALVKKTQAEDWNITLNGAPVTLAALATGDEVKLSGNEAGINRVSATREDPNHE